MCHRWQLIGQSIRKAPDLQGQNFVAPLNLQIPVKSRFIRKSAGQFSSFPISDCKEQDIKKIELTFTHLYEKTMLANQHKK